MIVNFDSTRADHIRATALRDSEVVMLDGTTRTLSQLRTAEAWLTDDRAPGQYRDAAAAQLLHSPYEDHRRLARRHITFPLLNAPQLRRDVAEDIAAAVIRVALVGLFAASAIWTMYMAYDLATTLPGIIAERFK